MSTPSAKPRSPSNLGTLAPTVLDVKIAALSPSSLLRITLYLDKGSGCSGKGRHIFSDLNRTYYLAPARIIAELAQWGLPLPPTLPAAPPLRACCLLSTLVWSERARYSFHHHIM